MSTRTVFRAAFAVASSLALLEVAAPVDAAQRTFVSTGGSDANACSLAAPCRGFAKAITVTDSGGELVVLDSGGYGSVTVKQDVTILSPAGVYAGLSVFGGSDGITIASPATKVVLRGLTINGQGGNNGIRVQAGEVHVESLVISNMAQAGIRVEGGSTVRISGSTSRSNVDGLRIVPAGTVSVLVRDSEFSNNIAAGIGISPSSGGANAHVMVERSSITKNGAGVVTAPGASAQATVILTQTVLSENTAAGVSSTGSTATVFVRESAITRNGTGLLQASSGVLNACGANLLIANTTAQSGAITTTSCLDVASASGTVTSVGTGTGLTGGPITSTGTIAADTTVLQQRVTGTCAAGNSIRTINGDGTVVCEADDVGGTGTVTSLSQGTGIALSANPITTTGSISVNTTTIQARVTGNCVAGNYIRAIAADGSVTCGADNSGPANAFVQGGNNFGATAVLGTIDNNALDIRVHDDRAMRYEVNTISPNVIGGSGFNKVASGVRGATIGGGGSAPGADPGPNVVTSIYGTVGGGNNNRAGNGVGTGNDAAAATVAGGVGNTASGNSSVVGGGAANTASGLSSAVVGGESNDASGDRSVVGGFNNTASGASSVAFGSSNLVQGFGSVGLGRRTKIPGDGTFAFADSNDFDFSTAVANSFRVRATGGVRFVVDIDGTGAITWSCLLVTGSGWNCSSDRNLKQDLVLLDGRAVLDRLSAMPVYAWSPKGRNAHLRHYGPMAQDFHAAFALGDDDTMIGMQDADGVALAAIKGLDAKLKERDATITELRERLSNLESLHAELAALRSAVADVARSRPAATQPD